LIWEGQRAGITSFQQCSNLNENFQSRVFISRACNAKGQWEDVDFSGCSMHFNSYPVIVVQKEELSNNESDINKFENEVGILLQ